MSKDHKEQLQEYLKTAEQAALLGGDVLLHYWGKLSNVKQKGFFWDLVTEADMESEKVILEFLREKTPGYQTLSEEAGLSTKEADYLWVIDPLDGTTNYTHQYPMLCVSIALLHQGHPVVGVVFNPIHKESFKAVKGQGTTLNEEPIKVSQVDTLSKSLLATGFAYDRQNNPDTNYAEFCHITHISHGVRRGGSAALDLAYVAAGRLDGFWERGLKPWDMAAGMLLVQEAGGKVSSYDMKPLDLASGRILATNGFIHSLLSNELQHVKKAS